MDTAMRDMERIQEVEPAEATGRRLAVVGLAGLVTVTLVFSVAVWVGSATRTVAGDAQADPLDALDRAAGLAQEPAPAGAAAAADVDLDPADLTFPETLTASEESPERPEVEAALAAAAAELEHPDPLEGRDSATSAKAATDPNPPPRPEAVPPSLPASVAAAPDGDLLARTAERDPLVSAAQPRATAGPRAPKGREGKYTLQVISYRSPEEAEAFADGLRTRGHEAYVVSADIPERGRHWRVRIGPFDKKAEVEAYRRDFEQQERMNTFVVKREER